MWRTLASPNFRIFVDQSQAMWGSLPGFSIFVVVNCCIHLLLAYSSVQSHDIGDTLFLRILHPHAQVTLIFASEVPDLVFAVDSHIVLVCDQAIYCIYTSKDNSIVVPFGCTQSSIHTVTAANGPNISGINAKEKLKSPL